METEGILSPESVADARAAFESAGPTAKQVVRETAKAMEFDREEYRERVTSDVIERARNVLFAERLAVTVGTRQEFDEWVEAHPDYEVTLFGSPDVDRVVWHAAPFAEEAVAATFQNERDAAVGTLRRQAFSRIYRPRFEAEEHEAVDSDDSEFDDVTDVDGSEFDGDADDVETDDEE